MASKQKIYAVKKGNKEGLFYTWEECQAAIEGFSSPDYKSFLTKEEAEAYLENRDIVLKNEIIPRLKENKVVAFVDGSFNEEKSIYGYGVYIFASHLEKPVELCGKGDRKEYADLRNITGEILGSINAIDWAWKNGYDKISIFHDYEGLGKWASGEWEAKKPISQFYKKFVDEKKDIVDIEFVKVSGHSNNKYNDKADALAKSSVNKNKILKDNNGNAGYIINNINNDKLVGLLADIKIGATGVDYVVDKRQLKNVYIVTFGKDKVTLSIYNDIKLLVQGKKSNLFQMITTAIIEKLDCSDFIKILKDAYEIGVKNENVDNNLYLACPNLKGIVLPLNIEKLLKQSVIDLENAGYNDVEFSKYTLSSLRALEGVLKYSFNKYGIYIPKGGFSHFDKVAGVYVLKPEYSAIIPSQEACKIQNCYNHYFNNRHTLCHFGYVFHDVDTDTRLLNSKVEANSVIKATLKVINDNYII